jgi:alginate O-acetyltransferase complex protein AlgI
MWLLAGCLFAFFKWLTWAQRSARCREVGAKLQLAYLFGWVGLDVEEFCTPAPRQMEVAVSEWAVAALMTVCGAALLWGVIPQLHAFPAVAIGGLGFAGLILFLHFGLFHLLALAWRRAGVGVEPIMHMPLLATSLADFWGQRWNRAYRRVSYDWFFRPAVNRFGLVSGTLVAFFASGIIHDLVVSVPAGAGYGGPTAYFVIQGLGLLLERAAAWRRLTSRFPVCGWLYTLVFLIGPVGLLFHDPFLTRVIVPFLEMIGAR